MNSRAKSAPAAEIFDVLVGADAAYLGRYETGVDEALSTP